MLLIALAALVTTGIWFGLEIASHGWWFVNEFITYQVRLFQTEDADHGGPFFYHWIVLLLGCFPASAFLFQYDRKRVTDNESARDFTRWMWILFWVVLILFSIVKTKIVHYSSLCYFPLIYLAALQVYRAMYEGVKVKNVVKVILLVTGSLIAIAIAALPVVGLNKDKLVPIIDDPFAVGNLQALVPWSYAECIWGVLYLVGIWVAVFMLHKRFRLGMLVLCIVQLVMIQVTVLHFTPKIEAYSQRAAIDFFKSLQGKDCYVHVLGYKSYAHLFYTRKTPPSNPQSYNEDWLLNDAIDKPVYFICKITSAPNFAALPQLQQIGEKNGFVFFRRMP
jgi:uncharacterized membrane protein YiaA